ncbi:MAG: hypothetical protein ACRDTE_08215 [Pseudonocardiaceae bacterium]
MSGNEWVLESYRTALGHVHQAAGLIEDTLIVAYELQGRSGRMSPTRLLASLDEVYADINFALYVLRREVEG